MFLKLLLGLIAIIVLGIFLGVDFNKALIFILFIAMATFQVAFCFMHPLVGITAVVCILILGIIYFYETGEPTPKVRSNGLVYTFLLLFCVTIVLEVIETFTGRLF